MTDVARQLLELLDIEQLEIDLFRGIGSGGETTTRIFGGHVIAQALMAAYRTVPDRMCHSLHAYFIRPGDPTVPIIYQVDHSRDGGSFTTRRVVAIQHGKQIFNMAASFQTDEDSWEHQHKMPDVEGPEGLPELRERRMQILDKVPEAMREDFTRERDIEIRDVDPLDLIHPEIADDRHNLWFRVSRPIDVPPALHHCLLAYASDMSLLSSSYRPHGITWLNHKELMSASLDHAMWLHAPIKFDEWHLYSMDSPFAGKGRGLNRGMIYNMAGDLVASVAQEGLVRRLRTKD